MLRRVTTADWLYICPQSSIHKHHTVTLSAAVTPLHIKADQDWNQHIHQKRCWLSYPPSPRKPRTSTKGKDKTPAAAQHTSQAQVKPATAFAVLATHAGGSPGHY